jgi:nucleosome assembly protein 1-like 1
MVQSKLGGLVGRDSGYLEALPAPVKRRVQGLKGIQVEHSKIEKDFQLELLELEKKFSKRYAPLYARRAEIIAGKSEPSEDEVHAGNAADEDDEDEDEEARVEELNEDGSSDAPKGIPEFWLTALKNHSIIGEQITENDEEVRVTLLTNSQCHANLPRTTGSQALDRHQVGVLGHKAGWIQAPLPLLTQRVLRGLCLDQDLLLPGKNAFVRTFNTGAEADEIAQILQEDIGYGGEFVYDKAVGHEIKWKEDKDLTKTVEIKKQRNKSES